MWCRRRRRRSVTPGPIRRSIPGVSPARKRDARRLSEKPDPARRPAVETVDEGDEHPTSRSTIGSEPAMRRSRPCAPARPERDVRKRCCHGLDGRPRPHAGKEVVASSVTPAFGRAGRDQKSPLRRCFKPRSPCETRGAPVQISGCRLPRRVRASCLGWSTDRHAATGTCEFGQPRYRVFRPAEQVISA